MIDRDGAASPGLHCRVAIVGGGITGLAAAHRLQEVAPDGQAPPSFRLLEPTSRLGGVIRTEAQGGHLLEGGPDTLLVQKPAAVALCERLGLREELISIVGRPPMIVHGGRMRPLPEGFLLMGPTRLRPLVSSRLFSLRGKLRMALEPLVPARRGAAGDESLASFVRRRFGREALERAAEPTIGSLFTADAERLSLGMSMPRFPEMERRYGSVTRGLLAARRSHRAAVTAGHTFRGQFVTLRGGLQGLVHAVLGRIPASAILAETRVDQVDAAGDGRWRVRLPDGRRLVAEAVILACPAYASARLLEGTDRALARDLAVLDYASCATVSLGYRESDVERSFESYGFFVPRTENIPILACSFVSRKFPGRTPPGRVLFRAFVGGALQGEVLDLGDGGLAGLVHGALARLLSIRRPPVFTRVFRFSRAMPQFSVGHGRTVERLREGLERHPGLFLAGSALGAMGIPDSVASGEAAAEAARAYLAARPARARAERLPESR